MVYFSNIQIYKIYNAVLDNVEYIYTPVINNEANACLDGHRLSIYTVNCQFD